MNSSPKNETSVIIYSHSCHSKPVCTEKNNNMLYLINTIVTTYYKQYY